MEEPREFTFDDNGNPTQAAIAHWNLLWLSNPITHCIVRTSDGMIIQPDGAVVDAFDNEFICQL